MPNEDPTTWPAELTAANVHKAEAEAAKFEAEAQKVQFEVESARYKALTDEVTFQKLQRSRAIDLAGDDYHNTYYFHGPVDSKSCNTCMEKLNLYERTSDEPGELTIVFFSPGGSVFAGMALFDHIVAMRERGWKFTTVTRGYAASMGGILLQAGDVRICGPESYILIHEISTGAVGKIGELEDEVEFVKLIQKRVNDLFVARSNGKITASKLRSMYRRKDFWLDSVSALKLGIVDEIG